MKVIKNRNKIIATYTLVTPSSQFELFLIQVMVDNIEEFWEVKLNRGYIDLLLKLDAPDGRERVKYYNKLDGGCFYHTINLDNGEILNGLRDSDDEELQTINSKWILTVSGDVEVMQRRGLRGL